MFVRDAESAPPNQQDAAMQKNGFDIGNGDARESVGKFCYLGDMNADGEADSAVVARICMEEVERVVFHLQFQTQQ